MRFIVFKKSLFFIQNGGFRIVVVRDDVLIVLLVQNVVLSLFASHLQCDHAYVTVLHVYSNVCEYAQFVFLLFY